MVSLNSFIRLITFLHSQKYQPGRSAEQICEFQKYPLKTFKTRIQNPFRFLFQSFPSPGAQGGGALSTCAYREVSPIGLGKNMVKNDIFGSEQNWNYVHDIFYIKRCSTDISGFSRSNSDLYLHCFRMMYVHVQVS